MKETIQYGDFEKLDLRVAEILKVEEIPGADKLWKLTIDVGELGERVICAGIKKNYEAKKLKGKRIIIIANLAPRMLKGIESKGMLLAASDNSHENVILLTTDSDIEPGSQIS